MIKKGSLGSILGYLFSMVGLTLMLSSCSATMSAIQHRHLKTVAKMSNTIFLTPVAPSERTIFVEVKNTSQVQLPDLQSFVAELLKKKGYRIVDNPQSAHYWLQANVRYMGKESKSLSMDTALMGGYGGALLGSAFGGGLGKAGTISAGAIGGAIVGALVGSAIHVDRYMGVVDIQVKEKVKGAVHSETTSNFENGIGTSYTSTYRNSGSYQAYRTRIVVTATQTNMNLKKAIPIIESILAREIAGIF